MGIESAAGILAEKVYDDLPSDSAGRVMAAKALLADFLKVAFLTKLTLNLDGGTIQLKARGKTVKLSHDEETGDITIDGERVDLDYNPLAFKYVGESGDPDKAVDILAENVANALVARGMSSGPTVGP